MSNRVRTIDRITVRCSVCKRVEDEHGNNLITTQEQQDTMDAMQNIFQRRGWQMETKCPYCKRAVELEP